MSRSILQEDNNSCYLCGGNNGLDKHHIFGASNRNKSERDGLFVYLCHISCHIFGPGSAHQNKDINLYLKRQAQLKAMEIFNWSVEEFRKRYGKSYI